MTFARAVFLRRLLNTSLIVFLILSSPLLAQESPVSTAEMIRSDLSGIECDNKMRQEAAKKLFAKMGAGEAEFTAVLYPRKVTNLVLQVSGTSTDRIVVGAHYDKSRSGCGAVDNWSGLVIVAHLYKTIRASKPKKTFVFVGFGREEEGLLGSRAMVDAIPKEERPNYCAMVNLDSFGMGRPQALENASTSRMTEFARKVAKEMDIPFASGVVPGDGDSSPFRLKGIPALTLHGLAGRFQEVVHTGADEESVLNLGSIYLGYQFALRLVARLDGCECSELR